MARKQFSRTTRRFQLRLGNEYPQDQNVLSVLDSAKKEKREVEVIRDAIELFNALEQGNLDALFEKFPQYRTVISSKGGAGGSGIDEDKLAERIAEKLALLTPHGYTLHQPFAPTGKLIAAPVIAPPSFADDDDDAPLLILCKDTHIDTSWNFIHSLGGIR